MKMRFSIIVAVVSLFGWLCTITASDLSHLVPNLLTTLGNLTKTGICTPVHSNKGPVADQFAQASSEPRPDASSGPAATSSRKSSAGGRQVQANAGHRNNKRSVPEKRVRKTTIATRGTTGPAPVREQQAQVASGTSRVATPEPARIVPQPRVWAQNSDGPSARVWAAPAPRGAAAPVPVVALAPTIRPQSSEQSGAALDQYMQKTSLPKDPVSGLTPAQQYEAYRFFNDGLPLFNMAVNDYRHYAGHGSLYATVTAPAAARSMRQFLAMYDRHAPYLSGYASGNDLVSRYASVIAIGRRIVAGLPR